MAAPARWPEQKDFYTRRLVYARDKSLVESRCSRCGTLVIGSATESLIADEQEHMRQCLEFRETGRRSLSKSTVSSRLGARTA